MKTLNFQSSNDQAISKPDNQVNSTDLKKNLSNKQEPQSHKQGDLTESHINESYKLNRLG